MSAKKILVREEDGNTSLVNSQSGSGSVTGTTDDASPSFTGSIPTAAVDEATSGVGFESDPVYGSITTTGNFMAAKDQYAGFWFLTATQAPCLIVGNDATMGALGSPLSLTVFGPLPPTAAEAFKILRAPTPADSVATHSHAAGTLAGPAHTHTITSP
jgi:hypothetical protein